VGNAYRSAVLSQGIALSGRYVLNERIATGGMGDVWRGTDVVLKREVAVKVLLPSLISDLEFITRFRAEARMMAALRHPGIAQVYDFGEAILDSGAQVEYLVMEYVRGNPLSSQIKAAGQLSVAEALSIVAQTAQALHAAHTAGIIHRDVKPSNVLVQPDGSVVLVDFGVARSVNMTGITRTDVVLGTASYMAPEQVVGQPVSAATDIYALGAVAYCCLVGKPPFTDDSPLEVAYRHLRDEPPALPAGIPPPVAELIARALAKDPTDRYASATDFAAAARAAQTVSSAAPLAFAIEAQGGAALSRPRQSQIAPPTPRAAKTNRIAVGTVAIVAAITLMGLVAALVFRPWTNDAQADQAGTKASAASSIPVTAPEKVTKNPSASSPTPTGPAHASKGSGELTPTGMATPTNVATTTQASPTAAPTSTTTASNPYTPAQVCGSGYKVIDSAALTKNGTLQATAYLLYNSGNGYNCTVTLKKTAVGVATTVSAYMQVEGHAGKTDSGSYADYAGPVRAAASSVCVKWGGSAGGASYTSPYEHCG
jgi:eukaryotic-like serine/threonine-protein kinase